MKRVITIVLAMAMALSVCSVAYAENGESNKHAYSFSCFDKLSNRLPRLPHGS